MKELEFPQRPHWDLGNARLRIRKVKSRSVHPNWRTMTGIRGQLIIRVCLRTRQDGRAHDIHLGQAFLNLRGVLDPRGLSQLSYRCQQHLETKGVDPSRCEELLVRLRDTLRKRGLLIDSETSIPEQRLGGDELRRRAARLVARAILPSSEQEAGAIEDSLQNGDGDGVDSSS